MNIEVGNVVARVASGCGLVLLFALNLPIRAEELFNGQDLSGWSTFLVDSRTNDPRRVFAVTNGMIRISGDGLGYLATQATYTNYHLTVEYRWGDQNYPWGERIGKARDSGVFLHATGPDGNSDDGGGAFMAAIECNVFQGATGDFLLIRGKDEKGRPIAPRITSTVALDADADGWFTWSERGQPKTVERWGRVNWRNKDPRWRDVLDFRGRNDLAKSGWNKLECICRDATIEIRLNGVTVNRAANVWPQSGKILLQCEGSEVFFRRVSLELPTDQKSHPFFPFCIDWHDAKKRSFQEQAVMLKELGYDGVGHIWLDRVAERLKTLDQAGLKLFQITMVVEVGPDKKPYDGRFKEVLALVQGRRVQFCLLVNGMNPSDSSVDPHAVKIVREMSDLAKDSGAQLLLYPHQGSWIERIEDSIRVAEKVNRPNVGVIFNLCHWLRIDKSRDYTPLLRQAMPRLWAVSINGAENFDEQPGWSRYIQPLDSGTFDVAGFLRNLKELGYRGPIGLQCFEIGGDTREHLARSMDAWNKLRGNLKD